MRRKKWAVPELESAPFFIKDPAARRGAWRESFARPDQPFMLEVGCGKGGFISRMAFAHPETNFLAVDMISNVLGTCKRNIDSVYEEKEPDNILVAAWDAERIGEILSERDRVERLYINFCNPWPKARHHKRRLTHTRQLQRYRPFLVPKARLYFKTDDDGLFLATQSYLAEAGFRILDQTRDLHARPEVENVRTEHEEMFSRQGIPIKFLIAEMLPQN